MSTKYYDNTRLSTHRSCNRKFFFRHVMDLAPVKPSPALIFGGCWHKAMDAVWSELSANPDADQHDAVKKGTQAFMSAWMEEFGLPPYDEMDDDNIKVFSHRTPETAVQMLTNYVAQRRGLISSMKLLEVEKPFAVPLFPDRDDVFYVGRLDKVVEWNGRVWVIEHKTTSLYRKAGAFAPEFIDGFSVNSQIDGYIHALTMEYPEKAKGVLVDAALVHKTENDKFRLIPVERQFQQIEAWLWEAHHEVAIIENSQNYLQKVDMEKEDFMFAFPKDTGSCFQFFSRCPYFNICRFFPNPMKMPETPPEDLTIDKWEPYKELDLDKLGLEDEQ